MKYRKLLLITGLIISLVFTAMMVMRSLRGFGDFRKRGIPTQNATIAPWMNIPHVARNFAMPPKDLADLLQLSQDQRDRAKRLTLGDIAKARGQSFEQFSADLRRLIEQYKQTHTTNPTPPPDVPAESP